MSTQPVSELRLRMIGDMKARQLNQHTQRGDRGQAPGHSEGGPSDPAGCGEGDRTYLGRSAPLFQIWN